MIFSLVSLFFFQLFQCFFISGNADIEEAKEGFLIQGMILLPVAVGDFRHIQNVFHMRHFKQIEQVVEGIAFKLLNQLYQAGYFVGVNAHNGVPF